MAGAGTGCTGPRAEGPAGNATVQESDPAEPINRAVFAANLAIDHALTKPIAEAYQNYIPAKLRQGVHNVVTNLGEPKVAANDLIQANFVRARTAALRLAVNTTVGIGGIVDVAAKEGLPPHNADFGETLAVWGIGEGPFVELPGLGPSNLRDAVGTVAGFLLDPITAAGGPVATSLGYARGAAEFVDTRSTHLSDLDELERTSIDYYATLRSVYRQHRNAEIDAAKANSLLYRRGAAVPPEAQQ